MLVKALLVKIHDLGDLNQSINLFKMTLIAEPSSKLSNFKKDFRPLNKGIEPFPQTQNF